MVYAYLRASNGKIDLQNQKKKLIEYCDRMHYEPIFVEDTISSGKDYSVRKISTIVDGLVSGDVLIVAELSRLARNTEQTLMIGRQVLTFGASMIILNPKIEFDGSLQSEILLTVMGMTSSIERYYIRSRTKIALDIRRAEIAKKGYFIANNGRKVRALGTPKGAQKAMKLEAKRDEVYRLVSLGVSQSGIAKITGVTRQSVARFLKRYPAL